MEKLIENIEIRNFKSIRQLTMNDCRRINILIGYPNVGKSNLLEALSLLSILDGVNFSSLVRFENNTTLFFNGNIESPFEVIIDQRHRVSSFYAEDQVDFVYQFDFKNKGFSRTNTTQVMDESVMARLSYKNGKTKIVNKNRIKEEDRLSEIKKYEFLKKINYTEGSFDKLIQPYGNNIFDVISTHESIRKEIVGLFKRYDLKFAFDKSIRVYKLLKDLGEDIFLIPYSMIADTLQRLIFFKTAILSNKNSVLLFEEPEAHMFPPYISIFTTDIWDNKENQYFMATHSPYVMNDFFENAKDELAVYILDYKYGETIIKRLSDDEIVNINQYGIDLFFTAETFLS